MERVFSLLLIVRCPLAIVRLKPNEQYPTDNVQ